MSKETGQGAGRPETSDLAELERQLNAVMAGRSTQGEDPLLELARIVGQADQAVGQVQDGRAPSFDDFLAMPPKPAMGAMPSMTPPIEPLFPEKQPSRTQEMTEYAFDDDGQGEAHVPTLRGALDEPNHPARAMDTAVQLPLDDFEAELLRDFAPRAGEPSPMAPVARADEPAGGAGFSDMMAEFEEAMRDAGAKPVAPAVDRFSAIEDRGQDGFPASVAAGAVAASAAVAGLAVAGGKKPSSDAPAVTKVSVPPKRAGNAKRGLVLAASVVGVSVLGVVALLGFGTGTKQAPSGQPPVIAAKPGVTKEKPAEPGGLEVPNQDREVLQRQAAGSQPAAPVRVIPREEQPLDLNQAQRQAEAQGIRQIPGVAIVAPVSTTPPAGAAPEAPAPRPVASVPITILNQPAAPAPAPVAATPVVPAPVAAAPVAAAPGAPAPAPVTNSAPPASATATSATDPKKAAAATEPRRVRTVPIRAEGETAPARPAARANAPAAEPEDPNAPLRITPAANRARQQVAAAPAATTAAAAPTQASPTTTASSGSFAVQLGAEGSEDAARAKFSRLRSQHSGVLGGSAPNIRSAEVNGRSVYRIRVGSYSREEAVSLCERLKAEGGSCFVARN